FIPGTSLLVFVSNRPDDTIRKGQKFEVAPSMKKGTNLFAYDLKKGGVTLFQMTDEQERVRLSNPNPIDSRRLLFLTNAAGKTDLAAGGFGRVMDHVDTAIHYRRTFESVPFSNRPAGLREIDAAAKAGVYTSLGLENGRYVLAVEPLSALRDELYPKLPPPTLAPPTAFKSEILDKIARMERRKAIADSLEAAAAADTAQAESAGAATPRTGRHRQGLALHAARHEDRSDTTAFDRYLAARAAAGLGAPLAEVPALMSDTADARRQSPVATDSTTPMADGDPFADTVPTRVPPKQYTYRPEFSINQATAQLGFSFLNTTYQAFTNSSSPIYLNSDVNGFTQISLSDLMENHRIIGGFSFSFDFTTFEYLLSYEYLERRLGHQFVFHIINRNDNSMNVEPYKQNTYNGYYVMKYPLSPVSMVKGTVFARYDRTVFKSYEWNSLVEPMQQQLKVGLKGEWVYDRSRFVVQNIYYGTRGKVFAEYYQGIVHDNQNLFVVGVDFRDYRRLYKTLIWANRIAASTSFGQQKLVYYMGGIGGWLLPRFNSDVK
ncbi:MAG: hypothetical protein K2H65_02340, partial [Bacteroidales bacterium]|nr:hypothetical protein [Bacteroidales bacterium]